MIKVVVHYKIEDTWVQVSELMPTVPRVGEFIKLPGLEELEVSKVVYTPGGDFYGIYSHYDGSTAIPTPGLMVDLYAVPQTPDICGEIRGLGSSTMQCVVKGPAAKGEHMHYFRKIGES